MVGQPWAAVVMALGSILGPHVYVAGSADPPLCFGRRPTIVGTSEDDRLVGTKGSDVIVARGGVDEIYGLRGHDYICGGPGYEVISDDEVGEVVVGDRIFAGPGNDRVRGGPHVDTIVGDDFRVESGTVGAGSDILIGGGGRDDINAGNGDNLVRGGPRADQLSSGEGDDVLHGGRGNDLDLISGHGDDRIFAGRGKDVILPMQGDDLTDGGEGRDLLNLFWEGGRFGSISSHRRELHVSLPRGMAEGMGGDRLRRIEDVWGGSGDDRIIGDGKPNLLGATDDQGEGRSDQNLLKGRGGSDRFIASPGADRLYGGPGRDQVRFALNESGFAPGWGVTIDLSRGRIRGESTDYIFDIEAALGTGGDDLFIGNNLANYFRGDYGQDTARGGRGPDVLYGGTQGDALAGNRGKDELDGGRGPNTNDGGLGIDRCVRPATGEGASRCER